VSCGGKHTLFLSCNNYLSDIIKILEEGRVYVCGLNDYGQLGKDREKTNMEMIPVQLSK
jgi:alpha-tubulin suppressor-like RCC1 family protein